MGQCPATPIVLDWLDTPIVLSSVPRLLFTTTPIGVRACDHPPLDSTA